LAPAPRSSKQTTPTEACRYSNSIGSSYSPSGNGADFYTGGSSGNQSLYGKEDGSRKHF
jgi:hypothetical protein